MDHNEIRWDKFLRIKTTGRDDSDSDQYKYPYEPTSYCVLERLANLGEIGKNNVLLDYGCGKGRVGFFLSYQTRCTSIGVEYNERIYRTALENARTAVSSQRVRFELQDAAQYVVPKEVDRFFFFNPFSVEILRKVIARILESWYEEPRPMFLYFYYPSEEYLSYLMTVEEMGFYDAIDCRDLFSMSDPREEILIFELSYEECA